jgi:large subunit ribosomal protein L35e
VRRAEGREKRALESGTRWRPARAASSKLRTKDLRGKTKKDLIAQLEDQRTQLAKLRVTQVTHPQSNKLAQIGVVRKNIARVLTVFNQQERSAVRERALSATGAARKFLPTDLRAKLTRAKRRELTAEQKAKVTTRRRKSVLNFPQRKYAIKA